MVEAGAGRIHVVDDGAVRTVLIEHPPKRNALTRPMLEELARVFGEVSADPAAEGPRVMLLRGAPEGHAFSSGFDLSAITPEERERGLDPIQPAADAIEACPVPVVACAEGAVFGGAVEILCACHIRVGASRLKLGMPPARLGLIYSTTGLRRLLRALPPAQVLRLLLTGHPLDGPEALRVGLLDELADDAAGRAREIAEAIAQNAPLAVRGTLDAVRRLKACEQGELSAEDAQALADARHAALSSEDLLEGVAAMAEKRPPVFRGR